MPSGVHCHWFRWFLGKCFLLVVIERSVLIARVTLHLERMFGTQQNVFNTDMSLFLWCPFKWGSTGYETIIVEVVWLFYIPGSLFDKLGR